MGGGGGGGGPSQAQEDLLRAQRGEIERAKQQRIGEEWRKHQGMTAIADLFGDERPARPEWDALGLAPKGKRVAIVGSGPGSDGIPAAPTGRGEAREKFYGKVGEALKTRQTQDLDEQHEEAQRRAPFGLARRGLLGGSQQVAAEGRIGKRRTDAEGRIAAAARGAERSARGADESLRGQLTSLVQSGLSPSAVATRGQRLYDQTAGAELAAANAAMLGDVFAGLGDASRWGLGYAGLGIPGTDPRRYGQRTVRVRTGYAGEVS